MNNLACFAMLLALGCATSPASPDRSVSSPTADIAAVANPDIAQESPAGAGVPCEQEIARECPAGTVDGCFKNLTSVHVCVPATAHAGPSCSQEVALQCGNGEVDACSLSPAPSTNHICVRP